MNIAETLELLAKKGWIQEIEIPAILEDEDIQKLSTKKGSKKKTTEERAGIIDTAKCDARIWKEGYDNIQCNFIKVDGECLCSRHLTKFNQTGGWWLGMIHEPRPENPVWNGVEHHWRTDKEGNEINLVKKTSQKKESGGEKKKRGRPKGSKNKKKKVQKNELTKEEILLLLEEKKKEKEKGEEKEKEKEKEEEGGMENEIIYKVDNVPYEINDNEIMDPEDYSPIGQSDGKGGIIFEDEEAEERHQLNIKKYNK